MTFYDQISAWRMWGAVTQAVCRRRCQARGQEVKKQPSSHPDTWSQCCHLPCECLCPPGSCFQMPHPDGWRQGHLPVISLGLQSQTSVSCRKTSASFNKTIFPGFCWHCAAPVTGFSSPHYGIYKPVRERPGREPHISSSHTSCSPAWRAAPTPNSQERKCDWPNSGQCPPPTFFWKEIILYKKSCLGLTQKGGTGSF